MKHFQAFRLDSTNHCLWRGDERVSLAPKAFDLLRYLIEHRERVVTQEEILDALWADTFVNQEVVKKYILGIRKVLGDRPDQPEFVRTVPKRGYQFVASVTEGRPPVVAERREATKPFIDRHLARTRLERWLERASAGARQLVFVTGEAGIGKSTFVDLFVQRASLLPNVQIARGQCIEGFGGQEPYYPLLDAIDHLIRTPDEPRFVRLLAERAPTWLVQFPSLIKPDQHAALQRELVGATRERMVREICDTLEAAAADRPLILILEDLHWADLSTLDVLSTFARRHGPARLLLIGTLRPPTTASGTALSRLRQDLAIRDLAREMPLQAFDAEEVSQYLAGQFSDAGVAADLAGPIHRHSGGNPLFVAALVRDLVANRIVTRDGERWTLTRPIDQIEPGVPPSLLEMLTLQFMQLTPAEQDALRKASVIGERFPAWAVASAAADVDAIEQVCEGLAERRLFIRTSGMGELADGTISAFYEFHHALYRQAVYRGLSDVARAKLHRLVGERLETLFGPETRAVAPEIALHFEQAHHYEPAIRYLMEAAANAARRFAVRDSLDVLEHAVGLVSRVAAQSRAPLEAELLERIGDAQYALGAMRESAAAFDAAAAIARRAGVTAAQVRTQIGLARPLGLLDPDRAITVLREAATASAGLDDPVMQARVDRLAAGIRLLYDEWRVEDARRCRDAHLIVQRADAEGVPTYDRMIYAHVQSMQGEAASALAAVDTGLATHSESTSVMVHLFAISAQVLALLQLGRFVRALSIVRASQEMAEKNGTDPWLFTYREAWLRMLGMDFTGAQRVCDALERSSVYPTGQATAIGQLAAGFQALDRGRPHDARRCFEEIRDPARTPKFFLHWYWRLHAQVGLTRAWLQSGDVVHARCEADRLIDATMTVADPNLQALAWETSACVAIVDANWSRARQSIDRALAVLSRTDAPNVAWQVHATACELSQRTGHPETAATHRASARDHIAMLADSLPPGEPLRAVLLESPATDAILCRPVAHPRPADETTGLLPSQSTRRTRSGELDDRQGP